MAGLFGALFLLACGGAHAYKDITEARDNQEARERARRDGRKYYFAIDGERTVDTNHKILRLPDGIKDMQTGEWLFDKKKQDALERKQLSELDEISKKEAIIKGEDTYRCTLHDSDPRRQGRGVTGVNYYRRLVNNDMPIEKTKRNVCKYFNEEKMEEENKWYYEHYELQFGFTVPCDNIEPTIKEIAFNKSKHWNMNFIMKGLCQSLPINELEVVYKYCNKYDIPLGTWEEIEAMMLKEQPLGWRKVQPCKDWEFENFMNSFIM